MQGGKVYIGSDFSNSPEWMSLFMEGFQDADVEMLYGNEEIKMRCDYILYVFTPNSEGISTIINVVNDSNHLKGKVLFCVLNEDDKFSSHQLKSIIATGKMIELNGGEWFDKIEDVIKFLA